MSISPEPVPEAEVRLLLVDAGSAGFVTPDELVEAMQACIAGPAAVASAGSGRQASERLRAERFDVVLLDLTALADLATPAAEAVARLVKLARGALVVAVSDGASVSATVEVMRAGAHDCVALPLAARALAARLLELSSRHGTLRLRGLAEGRPVPFALPRLEPRSAIVRPILPMWRQEQRIIEEAIASFSGNVALAAAALELSPSTIYRKRQLWAESDDKRGAA